MSQESLQSRQLAARVRFQALQLRFISLSAVAVPSQSITNRREDRYRMKGFAMSFSTYAIGDVHGRADLLEAMLAAIP